MTQALLGAATGGIVAGKTLGRRALGFGALLGMSPDLDLLLGPLDGGYGEWLYHRGTTHSLWFGFVAGPALGWLLWRWRDPHKQTPLRAWIALCVVALVTHPILDGFTPYGTQFFAPFSRTRFAWNGVAIVDPIYSTLLSAGVAFAVFKIADFARARRALVLGLSLSSVYLGIGLAANAWVVDRLERHFVSEGFIVDRVRAYPTIFQPWLRHFVVHSAEHRIVGFHNLFRDDCPAWKSHTMPATNPRIKDVLTSFEGKLLLWFADGDVGIEERAISGGGSIIRIDDLRYAWSSPEARGMWGIQARFDREGNRDGSIQRFASRNPGDRDVARLWRAIRGELPLADPQTGWQRPAQCGTGAATYTYNPAPQSALLAAGPRHD